MADGGTTRGHSPWPAMARAGVLTHEAHLDPPVTAAVMDRFRRDAAAQARNVMALGPGRFAICLPGGRKWIDSDVPHRLVALSDGAGGAGTARAPDAPAPPPVKLFSAKRGWPSPPEGETSKPSVDRARGVDRPAEGPPPHPMEDSQRRYAEPPAPAARYPAGGSAGAAAAAEALRPLLQTMVTSALADLERDLRARIEALLSDDLRPSSALEAPVQPADAGNPPEREDGSPAVTRSQTHAAARKDVDGCQEATDPDGTPAAAPTLPAPSSECRDRSAETTVELGRLRRAVGRSRGGQASHRSAHPIAHRALTAPMGGVRGHDASTSEPSAPQDEDLRAGAETAGGRGSPWRRLVVQQTAD